MERSRQKGEIAVRRQLLRFLRDYSAATAIEYGLVALGIAVALTSVLANVGTTLK